MPKHPENVESLIEVLMGLATYAGARVPSEWQGWLRSVGVADREDDALWMWPTYAFLADTIPAQDGLDLVRRVAVRDPLYRLHLDLSLIFVIHAVAVTERWRRLDEILFGTCRVVAPRLMQLLEWQMARTGRAARDLTDADWRVAHESVVSDHGVTFAEWDNQLWGECRGPAELFPLLSSLYLPLCCLPIHVVGEDSADEAREYCLAGLVKAAAEGEGVELSRDRMDAIRELQERGVPVRVWSENSSTFVASLVAPVTFQSSVALSPADFSPAPASVPAAVRRSCALRHNHVRMPTTLSALSQGTGVIVSSSLPYDCARWPATPPVDAPKWLPLPGADELAVAGNRRTELQADHALHDLAEHPLYGLVLQLLLLEALDRELGEETVVCAPPLNRKIDSFALWAETVVLYRPREEASENLTQPAIGFYVLGTFDEVFARIAHELGIVKVSSPLKEGSKTPWSKALALMSTADLVIGKHDRWTITTEILDRLHSGSLMKDIIRNGRTLREKMHSILLSLWQERSSAKITEAIAT